MRKLDTEQCARLLGSLIGGLTQTAEVETVRSAVRWWASRNADAAWNRCIELKGQSTGGVTFEAFMQNLGLRGDRKS